MNWGSVLVATNWLWPFCILLLLDQIQWIYSKHSKADPSQIIRQRLTGDALLPCKWAKYANGQQIEWWYREVAKGQLIGTFDGGTGSISANWTREGAYRITDNGTLLIVNVRRALVERYECVDKSAGRRDVLYLRLDFSNWYALKPLSLFFGSIIAAAVFCAASFLLNILWIFIRWIVLRWIKRTERLGRVRSMLEAMEKYRQKQMESLHEGYSRRVSQIRENYHNQMEMLRQSYAESADRFRDYKQARMDNVQQHLDNYSHQITRLREYGSRRVGQIWESYDRSISAVRTFTLEQRVKIIGQYKVKQRYVNKLLEAISVETNVEVISKKEAAIREVLGEEEPPPFWPTHSSSKATGNVGSRSGALVPIPRSASYYSLPEFVIDVDGHGEEEMGICAVDELELDDQRQHQPSTSASSFPPPYPRHIPQLTSANAPKNVHFATKED